MGWKFGNCYQRIGNKFRIHFTCKNNKKVEVCKQIYSKFRKVKIMYKFKLLYYNIINDFKKTVRTLYYTFMYQNVYMKTCLFLQHSPTVIMLNFSQQVAPIFIE